VRMLKWPVIVPISRCNQLSRGRDLRTPTTAAMEGPPQ
jgi:hypothetical protein